MSQLQHSYAAVAPVEAADLDLPDLAEAADAEAIRTTVDSPQGWGMLLGLYAATANEP